MFNYVQFFVICTLVSSVGSYIAGWGARGGYELCAQNSRYSLDFSSTPAGCFVSAVGGNLLTWFIVLLVCAAIAIIIKKNSRYY